MLLTIHDEAWFESFCAHRVNKIALLIYVRTKSSVSSARMDRFFDRLMKSVKGAKSERESEDLFYAMEDRILSEHKFFTYRMWKFCGQAVMRLLFQLHRERRTLAGREFPVLKRRLFSLLRKAVDDADVNARVDAFCKKVRGKYAARQ